MDPLTLLREKVERLSASRAYTGLLAVLKQLDIAAKETGGYRVCADAVGAGLGEVVLYATGSAARHTSVGPTTLTS